MRSRCCNFVTHHLRIPIDDWCVTQAMSVSGVYASGVGGAGAGGECAGVYRGGAGVYGVAAFHHHPQLHHHHHAAHPAAWLPAYAALIPPAHPAHAAHPAHPAHPAHIPIDSVPSQYVSTECNQPCNTQCSALLQKLDNLRTNKRCYYYY